MKEMNSYRALKEKIKDIKGYQILTAISLTIYTICLYVLIFMIQNLIDMLTTNYTMHIDLVYLFKVFGLLILLALSAFISQYFFNQLPIKAKNIFLGNLYEDILDKDISFFENDNQGMVYSLLNNDAVSFAQLIALNPVVVCYQMITLLLCIIFMLVTQWILAIILIFFVLLCFIFTNILSKKIANSNHQIFKEKELMTKYILEGLNNHKVIYMLSKQELFSKKFQRFLTDKLQIKEKKGSFYQSQYMTIYILLTIVIPFLSIIIGIYFNTMGLMTLGQILTMYSLSSQLQEPIRNIADSRTNRLTAIQLADRLSILLNSTKEKQNNTDKIKSIILKNISFAFDDVPLIKNLSMDIIEGDKVLIKGDSGCGKSTLLSLIMGVLKVNSGEILINDRNINEINPQNYYQHILSVNQNPLIFHDSIINNITLYDYFTDEEIHEVIETCQLLKFFEENKEIIIDINTISGGQAQRISIARMLLRKPDVLLLDEPTSALDEQTSLSLSEALNIYCQKYKIALVIVSHKKDIMSICDKVYEFKPQI